MTSGAGHQHGHDQDNIDQHVDGLKYAELEAAAQTESQFQVHWEGATANLTGLCPACHGQTRTDFAGGIGSSKAFRGPKTWQAVMLPSPLTLYCECGHMHEGRPPDAFDTGCGRYWAVFLKDEDRRPS